MLASRGGAVGKNTKDAYVCLSCRLKPQKRRYGALKARHGQAATTTNNRDIGGTEEYDLATYGRQLSERFDSYPFNCESTAPSIQSLAQPSRGPTTLEPDINGGLKLGRGQDPPHTVPSPAASSSLPEAMPSRTKRCKLGAESYTQHLIRHIRKHYKRSKPHSLAVRSIYKEIRSYPQYTLVSLSLKSAQSSVRKRDVLESMWRFESQLFSFDTVLPDNETLDVLQALELNISGHGHDVYPSKSMIAAGLWLEQQDLRWRPHEKPSLALLMNMEDLSRPRKQVVSESSKSAPTQSASIEPNPIKQEAVEPPRNFRTTVVPLISKMARPTPETFSSRPVQSDPAECEAVEPSLRLQRIPCGSLFSKHETRDPRLRMGDLIKKHHMKSKPREPRIIRQMALTDPRVVFAPTSAAQYSADRVHGSTQRSSPSPRLVPAGEPSFRQALETTIDKHLQEPSLAVPRTTANETPSPRIANPLSVWTNQRDDAGAVKELRDERVGGGFHSGRTTKTSSWDISEHYYHETAELSHDEPESTSAGFDERVKHTTYKSEEGRKTSERLDVETVTALDALEEAAAAAASSTKTPSSSLQTERRPWRTTVPMNSAVGGFAWQSPRFVTMPLSGGQPGGVSARLYHSSTRCYQQSAAALSEEQNVPQPSFIRYTTGEEDYFKIPSADKAENPNGIRAQLRKWQELHGHEDPMPEVVENDDYADSETPVNNLTRLPDDSAARRQLQQEEDEKEAFTHFADLGKEGYDGTGKDDGRFLKMGDLVEIEYLSTERESVLAVYVQSVLSGAKEAQFFTMQGRWMHIPERAIMYSIPGWVSPELVKPLLDHLPTPEDTIDMDTLKERAYTEDLSVPREVAAPLVNRMVDFHNESQEIYRKNASTLDEAHNILAHDTDLRYGSLVSAATTLLRTSSDKLPLTALYTVRRAVTHGGFAFNIDRRSHRLTGYMQIRSKEQVRMVENVREWIRQWQDDLAQTAGMDERQLSRRRVPKGAQHVYDFLEKAKAIIVRNRESRQPMPSSLTNATNNMGISKTRLPITETSDCIKLHHGQEFTADETEIVRFMESWACSGMFMGLPRIESLPPLLLQATGLYDNQRLAIGTGFVFLQELGTIMPYENRVRFDQHLLLPSSQHSKPLQNLMTSLMAMKNKHNFNDSMADLRHDWKDLPVYCIDDASAQEIDDGVSVEPAGTSADGKEQYWVHIHIANPTAFFSRDHPLAKMARHMGETIYMPERTYMMLPRWATERHFSLAPHRPALTFSAKLDEDGKTVDQKITSGTVHNVVSLTSEEVQQLLSEKGTAEKTPELVLTVGGSPPSRTRRSQVPDATEKNISDLRLLEKLAAKRANIRKSNGGIFFDSHKPKVSVWQSWKTNGLAWDHPYRKGSRIVEGDPVIQMRTTGLHNWFAPSSNVVDVLVRECMLLACETAASWCSERKVPVIHRGTIPDPQYDSRKLWEEKMLPAMREDGSLPMHLGVQYIRTLGSTVLRTEPKRHAFIGMDHYSKVTSPLRRYGDMILHWQIDAALRHEAQIGRSLITTDPNPNRSFLPFSQPVLDTIMLGLQPRESIIARAKARAEDFWTAMLLFRKHYFQDDGELPYKTWKVFIPNTPAMLRLGGSATYCVELGLNFTMNDPRRYGLDAAQLGDVWEVEIEAVDVYMRATFVKPLRLVGREGAGIV